MDLRGIAFRSSFILLLFFGVFKVTASTAATSISPWVLRPFVTDDCTGFPNGPGRNPEQWRHCCNLHDLSFWAGGCKRFRDLADLDLYSCVVKTGAPHTARIMYWGVRLGSHSPIKIQNGKWGNGWTDGRTATQALTLFDLSQLRTELSQRPPKSLSPLQVRSFLSTLEAQILNQNSCK